MAFTKKKYVRLGAFVNAKAIVEFEEWSIASIIRVGRSWRGMKTIIFCELQHILPKALLFITNLKIWTQPVCGVVVYRVVRDPSLFLLEGGGR